MRLKNTLKRYGILFTAFVFALSFVSQNIALAVDEEVTGGITADCSEGARAQRAADYSGQNISFHEPCDGVCTTKGQSGAPGAATASIDASGLPAETVSYIEGLNVKARAEENQERYMYAQEQTGVPWQVMASLHFREAKMDPGLSISNGAPLGSGVNVDGVNVGSDANQDAANMGNLLIELAKGVYDVDIKASAGSLTTEQWGKAFLSYNRGYLFKEAGVEYTSSPYVMNGFSSEYMNMSWSSADTVSGKDGNLAGALAILAYLGGVELSGGGGAACDTGGASPGGGVVQGDIVKTALGLALPTAVSNGTTDPSSARPEYLDAYKQRFGNTPGYPEITDCGRFVSTVMRLSGADTEFPDVLVSSYLIPHMQSSGKYEALGSIGMGEMQPGDIVATPEHVLIYTGTNGDYVAADASYEERVPSVRLAAGVQWMVGEGALVWRLKA